jgi:hypothetical protein
MSEPIDRTQVVATLLAACPSFRGPWEEYLRDPSYEEGLLYLDLGEFARHLVSRYQAGDTSEFPAVFRVVEDLHLRGDPFVREAATIGLLESLQNNTGSRDLDPEIFLPFLGPESAMWWDRLDRFWGGEDGAVRE